MTVLCPSVAWKSDFCKKTSWVQEEDMKSEIEYFHCGDHLRRTLAPEISDVVSIVGAISWAESFAYSENGTTHEHQAG